MCHVRSDLELGWAPLLRRGWAVMEPAGLSGMDVCMSGLPGHCLVCRDSQHSPRRLSCLSRLRRVTLYGRVPQGRSEEGVVCMCCLVRVGAGRLCWGRPL